MAAHDIAKYFLNNEKRKSDALVGMIAYNLPGGEKLVSGDTYRVGKIPAGSIITGIRLLTVEAFDSATSATVVVGDGTTADKFVASTNIKTTAGTVAAGQSAAIEKYYAVDTDIVLTPTLTGATTAGAVKVVIDYVEVDTKTGEYTE